MATYFCNCGDNNENFDLCLKFKVAGFPSNGYNTGDLVYLIFRQTQNWKLGAKGFLNEPTVEKPWEDAEKYKSAYNINWVIIEPTIITEGLQKIYPPNFGLAIQGKKNLDTFLGKGDELKSYFDAFFTDDKILPELIEDDKAKKTTLPINSMKISPKELIDHSHNYIESKGFRYKYEEIANFYLSLRAKPFVILAGISGTGKTQFPRKFAAALGFSKEQVIQVPVRPDWTDSSELLGYTSLDGNFIQKDLTIAILEANKYPSRPYFFILDEMNLARVEHYFSDFLSVIETRERQGQDIVTDSILRAEMLKNADNKAVLSKLGLPQNLYLIGTVNMDESTHTFSKKVLDRANTIEMNDIDLDWITTSGKDVASISNVFNEHFKTNFIDSKELSENDKKGIDKEMKQLQAINGILMKADLHFAYRVRDEIAFYLVINNTNQLIEAIVAFDFQLVQKILPRIHGSSERVQTVLIELLNLLETKSFRTTNFEISGLDKIIQDNDFKYPRASKKIIFMLKRFDDDRFTSFWL